MIDTFVIVPLPVSTTTRRKKKRRLAKRYEVSSLSHREKNFRIMPRARNKTMIVTLYQAVTAVRYLQAITFFLFLGLIR
jgi:hypothetical protein